MTTPRSGPQGDTGASRLPLWFIEGMASSICRPDSRPGTDAATCAALPLHRAAR
jgi:hypothetical protein